MDATPLGKNKLLARIADFWAKPPLHLGFTAKSFDGIATTAASNNENGGEATVATMATVGVILLALQAGC